MGTEKQGKGGASNGAVREELVQELKHLRTLVRDAGEQFILRREGEIETIISHLAAVPPRVLKASAPEWLQQIHGLRLKPAKGRLKDLKGIDRLIGELTDQVISGQDGNK
ncbi:MAG: hypothetical protein NDI77_02080 [Geobacteraceae bacterium]|nr:hypothetical protein [Geobacteraceae bacterium]